MADPKVPNQNANKTKAEGDDLNYVDENGDNAGGISNRPLDQEVNSQESLPKRGMDRAESRDGNADSESGIDSDEGRSQR
ncbi:hypothetical protein BH18ACI5_BH18ACI5_05210 [soil metagenome]